MKRNGNITLAVVAIGLSPWSTSAAPVGTAFTYQGQLKESGVPVGEMCDFAFRLFDAESSPPGIQVGPTLTFDGVGGNPPPIAVVNGLFEVALDFGSNAFSGDARWLEIDVCCSLPCASGFTTLSPRQEVRPVPYALALPAMRVEENGPDPVVADCVGAHLVHGPNVIGGWHGNTVAANVQGATIAGGGGTECEDLFGLIVFVEGPNTISADFATVGGGRNNIASGDASTVGGGGRNGATGVASTVGGGGDNRTPGTHSTVSGGQDNTASGAHATIPGGHANLAGGEFSFAAGRLAKVREPADVGGGDSNGDEGTFVWADSGGSSGTMFTSTGPDQFLIRAVGGVGIGTNTPSEQLDVAGNIKATGTIQSGSSIVIDGVTDTITASGGVISFADENLVTAGVVESTVGGFKFPDATIQTTAASNDGHSLDAADGVPVDALFVDNAGNVGIGTTSPVAELHLRTQSLGVPSNILGANDDFVIESTDAILRLISDGAGSVGSAISLSEFNGATFTDNWLLRRRTSGAGSGLDISHTNGQVMRLEANGNVGIGTTSPSDKLHVVGNIHASGTITSGSSITIDGTAGSERIASSDALEFHTGGDRALRLEPAGTNVRNEVGSNVIGGYSGNSVTTGVVGATISGGGYDDLDSGQTEQPNRVTNDFGTVGGGSGNQAGDDSGLFSAADWATVGGGALNIASGRAATVGGGVDNQASSWCTVGGGASNIVSGGYSTVGGGVNNNARLSASTVGGGDSNVAFASWSAVPGGRSNTAGGDYSFAAGRRAKVRDLTQAGDDPLTCLLFGPSPGTCGDEGTFVWADSTDADFTSTSPDQFLVRASGGMWFGTTSTPSTPAGIFINTSTGAQLTSTGVWKNASDAARKQNFTPVDTQEILQKVAKLPVTTWNYRVERTGIHHLGPTAQDFAAAFGLGEGDKTIGTIDADGVSLAAIQGLYELVQEKDCEIVELRRENVELAARMAAVERTLRLHRGAP